MLGAAQLNPIEKMRRQELMTATPAQLTVKLFQRLILDLHRAATDLQQGQTGAASGHLIHAQSILAELDGTLDVNAWDGAADLKSVYAFCLQAMATANQNSDANAVLRAIELLTPVSEAFEQAAKTA